MITCPRGHKKLRKTGTTRVKVGERRFKLNGVEQVFPAHRDGYDHYRCQVCGWEFSVHFDIPSKE